jgi:hypothetical protein
MICGARDGSWRRVLTLRCGEIVERRRNRRNAGDAEDGIEQGAIFGAQADNFSALKGGFRIFQREFPPLVLEMFTQIKELRFEAARVA